MRELALLAEVARCRVLRLGGRGSGARKALGVLDSICDLVVEPQPIRRARSADAASRACWQLDSREAWRVARASADPSDGQWQSGEPLSPTLEPHADDMMLSAHRRLRMDWQVNRQHDDERTCWWRLGFLLLRARRRSGERRGLRRPPARLARPGSACALGRCCSVAAEALWQEQGEGRASRAARMV